MLTRHVVAWAVTLSFCEAAEAASVQATKDLPWNSYHITHLPPDVQRAVASRWLTGPIAGHLFASYLGDRIILHVEYLGCRDGPSTLCSSGQCLRQVYREVRGRYRPERS
jgi:hypothetical protein